MPDSELVERYALQDWGGKRRTALQRMPNKLLITCLAQLQLGMTKLASTPRGDIGVGIGVTSTTLAVSVDVKVRSPEQSGLARIARLSHISPES